MKRFILMFLAVALLALPMSASAITLTATQSDTEDHVGGLPLCVNFGTANTGTGNLTVTLPSGFVAKQAQLVDTSGDGLAPRVFLWFTGMTNSSLLAGATVAFSASAAHVPTVAAGSIIFPDAMITDNSGAHGRVCR